MADKKSFKKKYKEIKTTSLIGIIFGLIFTLIGSIQMLTNEVDLPSILFLVLGICFLAYISSLFFLYWQCANYIQNNQSLPKWFRVITAIFCSFYLTFYNLKNNDKNSRLFILVKEIRFYVLLWIFLLILIITFEIPLIQKGKVFWLLISLLIFNIIWFIDLIMMILIWKYKGTNSSVLKILTIMTLNYRNYRLYKEIIKLNGNEEAPN